ncbi:hypothetical protein AB9F46_23295 [Rhizobium leguminosarum]|uniref:hypothetical protein n=1 Tax=Rhizobium leguminosarum TaxID=384 RepID=UPI003F951A47
MHVAVQRFYRTRKGNGEPIGGKLETVVNSAPNDTVGAFKFWQQVFTGRRGLAYIERTPQGIDSLWPMDPTKTNIKRVGFKVTYEYEGKTSRGALCQSRLSLTGEAAFLGLTRRIRGFDLSPPRFP